MAAFHGWRPGNLDSLKVKPLCARCPSIAIPARDAIAAKCNLLHESRAQVAENNGLFPTATHMRPAAGANGGVNAEKKCAWHLWETTALVRTAQGLNRAVKAWFIRR
jgi:hypothetical protein